MDAIKSIQTHGIPWLDRPSKPQRRGEEDYGEDSSHRVSLGVLVGFCVEEWNVKRLQTSERLIEEEACRYLQVSAMCEPAKQAKPKTFQIQRDTYEHHLHRHARDLEFL